MDFDKYVNDWMSRAEDTRSLAVYAVFVPLALAMLGVLFCLVAWDTVKDQIQGDNK